MRGVKLSNPMGTWKGVGEWVDKNKRPLVFAFPEPVRLTGYSWTTVAAPRGPVMDPLRWKMEGSPNGVFWEEVDDRTAADQYVPKARATKLAMFVLGGGIAPRPF